MQNSMFFVPMHNEYTLKNESDTIAAKLFFVLIKQFNLEEDDEEEEEE